MPFVYGILRMESYSQFNNNKGEGKKLYGSSALPLGMGVFIVVQLYHGEGVVVVVLLQSKICFFLRRRAGSYNIGELSLAEVASPSQEGGNLRSSHVTDTTFSW